MKNIIFSGILLFLLASCNTSNSEVKNNQLAFFDLKNYIHQEIVQKKSVKIFNKKIDLNNTKEEKRIENLSLEKELAVFIQSDINKTAWYDKYEIDSLFDTKGNLYHLQYLAKDESLRTRSISLSFKTNQIDTIKIHNQSSSSIADSEQFLTYIASYGYSILSRQKINLLSEHNLAVDVEFVY